MKKNVFFTLFVMIITNIFAQVGINEVSSKVTLDVKSKGQDASVLAGFRAPRISGDLLRTKTYTADHDGAIVFVTSAASIANRVGQTVDVKSKGYYYFDIDAALGGKWIQWISSSALQTPLISVVSNTLSGVYIGNTSLNNSHEVSFTVTNNSFQSISNIDFSNDVTVINGGDINVDGSANSSVTLTPGASKVLTYKLSGIPSVGNLTVKFDKVSRNLHAEISTVVLGSATIQNKEVYITSFTYTGNGNSVNIQGKINNTTDVLTVNIPYTEGNGPYNTLNQVQTSSAGEGGDVNNLTLTIPAGNFSSNGVIPAKITVGGDSEYLVKKMAPGQQYTIATYNITMNGKSYTVKLIGIGGVPDRRFGDGSNHDFVYLPVVGEDGRTWLNNNLGADYANLNHTSFNPTQQATSHDDYHAYGSSYQWGRYSDGHELVTWSSTTSGVPVNGSTSTVSSVDRPNHSDFILNTSTASLDWRSPHNFNLWQGGTNSINNPCPTGYSVPTKVEWENYITNSGIRNSSTASTSNLALTVAGGRNIFQGNTMNYGASLGVYWSTYTSYYEASNLYLDSSTANATASGVRQQGFSVRCIKD